MSSTWMIIILVGISGVAIMVIDAMGIPVTSFQIILSVVSLSIVFIGAVLYYFVKDRGGMKSSQKDYVSDAVDYAIKWAKNKMNIKLELLKDGNVTTRSYPPDKEIFVGMRLNRVSYDPEKAGQPVTIVVGTKNLTIRDFQDNPNPELLMNPFAIMSAGYSGSPTPDASPERDASMFRQQLEHQRRGTFINIGQGDSDFFKRKNPDDNK